MKLTSKIAQTFLSLTTLSCTLFAQAEPPCPAPNNLVCPPADCCDFEVQIKASYLYWAVKQDYLAFGIENVLIVNNPGIPTNATVKTHKPKWDSGFKLEGNLSHNCSPLSLHAEWIYFKTTSNASASSTFNNQPATGVTTVTTLLSNGNPFLFATNINSSWNIKINQLALDLDYEIFSNGCFTFTPYVGIFGAIINQHQNITNFNTADFSAPFLVDIQVSRNNKFSGIGPRLGINTNWNFISNFSLTCDANLAYLIGRNNVNNYFSSPDPARILGLSSITQHMWCGRPMANCFLTLDYNYCICNRYLLSLSVGGQFQYWWKLWHSDSDLLDNLFSGEGRWGNLSVYGLVASVGITF